MQNHTVNVEFDHNDSSYKYYIEGQEVKFSPLRQELDVRGGYEKRDPSYLLDEGVVYTGLDARKYLEFTVPWEVFPVKDGVYEVHQGNNRLKLLEQVILPQNIAIWEALKDHPNAYDEFQTKATVVLPFQITVWEIDPNNEDNYVAIVARQETTNNAVKKHSTLERFRAMGQMLNRMVEQNKQKPKQDRVSVTVIREIVGDAFNVGAARTFHAEKIVNADEFLQVALNKELLSPDTLVKIIDASDSLQEKYQAAGVDPVTVNHLRFYSACFDICRSEMGVTDNLRITEKVVRKVEEKFLNQLNGTSIQQNGSSAEQQNDSGEEQQNDSGEEQQQLEELTPFELCDELLLVMMEVKQYLDASEDFTRTPEGEPVYEVNSMKKLYRSFNAILKVLPETVAVKAERKAEQERQKAERAERLKAEAMQAKGVQSDESTNEQNGDSEIPFDSSESGTPDEQLQLA